MHQRPARPSGQDSARRAQPRRKPARRAAHRPPTLVGWLSSDAEEVERRRSRGLTEIGQIEPLEPLAAQFGSFRVRGGGYPVEIRSLDQPRNSCGCADHRVSGLGT